jgi:hypothetical protein
MACTVDCRVVARATRSRSSARGWVDGAVSPSAARRGARGRAGVRSAAAVRPAVLLRAAGRLGDGAEFLAMSEARFTGENTMIGAAPAAGVDARQPALRTGA